MFVKVLGSAAGGGFPQWNCSCNNCRRLRQGTFRGSARSQAQLAISGDRHSWYLVNASPDLRYQIEANPELHPRTFAHRDSPIQGVILTSAEVDAAIGLLLLRESQPLLVYSTREVRELLLEDNHVFRVLQRQPDQVRWQALSSGESCELRTLDNRGTGLFCTPQPTNGAFPGHVPLSRSQHLQNQGAVIGLFIEHQAHSMAFFPGVQTIAHDWLSRMENCAALLFDGTFWSDDELVRVQGAGKLARQMGHLPVGDPGGTLDRFSSLTIPRKIFIHINNTNPMLDEAGPEYERVRAAGWEVAFDGMELTI